MATACKLPATVTVAADACCFAAELAPVFQRFLQDIEHCAGCLPQVQSGGGALIRVQREAIDHAAAAHVLRIDADGIELRAPGIDGLRAGLQRLRQLLRRHGANLPGLLIEDAADFTLRGCYLDVTRGRVPQLATLLELVEGLALQQFNHLQLYVEHSFAYPGFEELWRDASPLTAADLLALRRLCGELGIELVPSVSCFGHSYQLLRHPRWQHLNELPGDHAARPYSLWDRMRHGTFDPSNDESLVTVGRLLQGVMPLADSAWVNICCDETVDLGRGRNRERAARIGVGRLYIDFVKRLCRVVADAGRRPMLWSDILLEHPAMIVELPPEACILHWDYAPEPSRAIDPIRAAGHRWLGCPGIHTWKDFGCQIDRASANLRQMAALTRTQGGDGLLVTAWGDLGHAVVLGAERYGLAHAAQAAWCAAAADTDQVDRSWCRLAYGDESGELIAPLRDLGGAPEAWWYHLALEQDPSSDPPLDQRDPVAGCSAPLLDRDPERLQAARPRLQAAEACFASWSARGSLTAEAKIDLDELALAARGARLLQEGALHAQRAAGRLPALPADLPSATDLAEQIRRFEQAYGRAWHARHRPSEYHRIRQILLGFAERLARGFSQK